MQFLRLAPTLLITLPLISLSAMADESATGSKDRSPRILFIVEDNSPACDAELARLKRPGGSFAAMERQGWKIGSQPSNHLQIVNASDIPDQISAWGIQDFPAVFCLEDGEIVRSFRDGCSTPLDGYTFGWLLKGVNERPGTPEPLQINVPTTGSYQLRGNHWNFEGNWSPSHEFMVTHLRGPNHVSLYPASWPIEQWRDEELRALHDDLHEMGRPRLPLDEQLEAGNSVRPGEAVPIYRPVVNSTPSQYSSRSSGTSGSSSFNAAQRAKSTSGSSSSGSGRGFF